MRVAPLAVTNAALTLCAVLTWVYGTANAQDKGILNPEPLPPLTKGGGTGHARQRVIWAQSDAIATTGALHGILFQGLATQAPTH
jgi:hypothetical protein